MPQLSHALLNTPLRQCSANKRSAQDREAEAGSSSSRQRAAAPLSGPGGWRGTCAGPQLQVRFYAVRMFPLSNHTIAGCQWPDKLGGFYSAHPDLVKTL